MFVSYKGKCSSKVVISHIVASSLIWDEHSCFQGLALEHLHTQLRLFDAMLMHGHSKLHYLTKLNEHALGSDQHIWVLENIPSKIHPGKYVCGTLKCIDHCHCLFHMYLQMKNKFNIGCILSTATWPVERALFL